MVNSRGVRIAVIAIIVIGAIIPIFHYWYYIGRVPSVTPQEAWDLLHAEGSSALLVDVGSRESFDSMHLEGARNWPYEELIAVESIDAVPEQFKEKTLLLICDSGIRSAFAAQKLTNLFGLDARNVKDGMQGWTACGDEPCGSRVKVVLSSGETASLPFKASPWHEQWALFLTGFVVKPFYMLLSLVLILILWRFTSPDAVALRWGLAFFLIGEAFCALNYMLFLHTCHLFEFFHGYGMVLSFGFATYAILEFIDLRIINYSDPKKKCAALSLCRQCIKYSDVPCGLKWAFYFLIPAHIVLAFIGLTAGTHAVSYNTSIFNTFYNYSHSVFYQIFEIRYCPIFAIILFLVSYAVLLFKKVDAVPLSKVIFAAGMGPLGFSFLRLIFFGIYRDNLVWLNFWEEITELMYVSGVAVTLWIFRRGLFQEKDELGAADEEAGQGNQEGSAGT